MQDVIDCINCAKKSTTADEGQRLDLIYLPREAMEQKKKDRKEKKCKMQKPIPRISKLKQQFMINSISPYPIMTAAGLSAFPHVGHDQPGSVYCCLCIKKIVVKTAAF